MDSGIARMTVAFVAVDAVDAVAMDARVRLTLVDI